MRRFAAMLLVCVMITGLAACNKQESAAVSATATPEPTADLEAIIAASESDAAAAAQVLPPASSTDALIDREAYDLAVECIGLPVEELYAVIGEPTESQYSPSCEGEEGAEDGMLFYNGFYIWSVRTEEEEIVREVYMNSGDVEETVDEAADGEVTDGENEEA